MLVGGLEHEFYFSIYIIYLYIYNYIYGIILPIDFYIFQDG